MTGAQQCVVGDDLSDIGRAVEWAGQLIAATNLSGDTRFGIEVCLEEALANLILHGRARDGAKDIIVTVTANEAGAMIEVADRCAPFDVAHAPSPPRLGGAAMLEGGRGLTLMRSFASELSYHTSEGRNLLTMRFTDAGRAASAAA